MKVVTAPSIERIGSYEDFTYENSSKFDFAAIWYILIAAEENESTPAIHSLLFLQTIFYYSFQPLLFFLSVMLLVVMVVEENKGWRDALLMFVYQ